MLIESDIEGQYRQIGFGCQLFGRFDMMAKKFENAKEGKVTVSAKNLKKILADKIPQGLCCPYYKDGMGTMWSIVFHTQQGMVEICFGSPDKGEWQIFKLKDKIQECSLKEVEVILQNEEAPDGIWDDCK